MISLGMFDSVGLEREKVRQQKVVFVWISKRPCLSTRGF